MHDNGIHYVVPVDVLLEYLPWAELREYAGGDVSLVVAGYQTLPVVVLQDWWDNDDGDDMLLEMMGEWPKIINQ